MPQIARIIGGAGTGKTSRLLDLMAATIEAGQIGPEDIGFVSFTRAARSEAANRAAERFGCPVDALERGGWFRTLHSVCHRVLGVGRELLAGNAADRKWLEEALQEPVSGAGDEEGLASVAFESSSDAEAALSLWSACRNRLEPFEATWRRAEAVNDRTPSLEYCTALIERYEQAKRLDGRCDFVDLVARFAGWRFYVDGPRQVTPEGYAPACDVWFLDEQQDTSALLDAVCRRLIAPARWVYVVGDPYQSIYGWAGADARYFMGWEVAKQEVMPTSFRCPRKILELGERVLRECSDYWDRGIAPSEEGGSIEGTHLGWELIEQVDPRESWLLLARSNYHAKRLAAYLDGIGVPWTPTRGNGGWHAPVTNAGILALYYLEQGAPIDGRRWKQALKLLPSKGLLERGVKKQWEQAGAEADEVFPIHVSTLEEFGATDGLKQALASKAWRMLVDGAERFCSAIERWGEESVTEPRVRVSTIHGAKGMEADNVLLLTSTSQAVSRAMETQDGANEERRVQYVGVTRARKRLVVAKERSQFEMEIGV